MTKIITYWWSLSSKIIQCNVMPKRKMCVNIPLKARLQVLFHNYGIPWYKSERVTTIVNILTMDIQLEKRWCLSFTLCKVYASTHTIR